jgi:hypothetical protein
VRRSVGVYQNDALSSPRKVPRRPRAKYAGANHRHVISLLVVHFLSITGAASYPIACAHKKLFRQPALNDALQKGGIPLVGRVSFGGSVGLMPGR